MKKIISLILALTMVFALAVTASAVDIEITAPTTDGTYGEDVTYTAYKVFSASVSEDGTKATYTIKENGPFWDVVSDSVHYGYFSGQLVPGSTDEYVETIHDNVTVNQVVTMLQASTNKGTGKTATYSNGKFIIENVEEGYYYIESSFGTGIILDTVGKKTITVEPKNELPTIEKKIVAVNGTNITATDSYTAKIGDAIKFELAVTIPSTAVIGSTINVYDVMEAGLQKGGSLANGIVSGLDGNQHWSATESPESYTSLLGSIPVTADNVGTTFKIPYTVTLDTDAVVGGAGNKNKAWIEYKDYTSEEVEATVYTYGFDLNKTNDTGTTITGAEFYLSKSSTHPDADGTAEQNLITFTNSGSVYTTDAGGYSSLEVRSHAKIQAGSVQIRGLAEGTYYLHEVKAPDGYNKLEDPVKIVISKDGITQDGQSVTGLTVQVINESGAVLPSTGGMGTTLFYVLGSLMAVTALVVLVTNKRMRT